MIKESEMQFLSEKISTLSPCMNQGLNSQVICRDIWIIIQNKMYFLIILSRNFYCTQISVHVYIKELYQSKKKKIYLETDLVMLVEILWFDLVK